MDYWTQLQIKVPTQKTQAASDIAQMATPYGIYIEDYSNLESEVEQIAHIDLIDQSLIEKDRTQSIIHIYFQPNHPFQETIAFLEERLQAESIPYLLLTDQVKEEDWTNSWKQYYHPMRIGKHLIVCPSWEIVTTKEPKDVPLILNPGAAFGTGSHETTKLCLAELERQIKPNSRLLDIGCGSGILSIAGILLGASSAFGVDIDPLAVKNAKENAKRNGLSTNQIQFVCGSFTEQVSGQYDIVCANIVADAILTLSETISPFLKPGGIFLCSGIIKQRVAEVLSHLKSNGFELLSSHEKNGWIAIVSTVS